MRILTGIKNLCDLINGFHHGKFVVIGIARGSWGIHLAYSMKRFGIYQ